MADLEQIEWHKEQQFFKSQIKTANLLLYGFLPLGLVTFLIQIIDDIIVYEEHLVHDIVLMRNLAEILPVIILILVYKEVDRRYMSEEDLSKLDIVMNDISSYVQLSEAEENDLSFKFEAALTPLRKEDGNDVDLSKSLDDVSLTARRGSVTLNSIA